MDMGQICLREQLIQPSLSVAEITITVPATDLFSYNTSSTLWQLFQQTQIIICSVTTTTTSCTDWKHDSIGSIAAKTGSENWLQQPAVSALIVWRVSGSAPLRK